MTGSSAKAQKRDYPARANLLFVDDERRVLNSMRAMFRRQYNIYLANSGAEALRLLENEPIDVVVSDQRMPGMTGVEVLKAFKECAPNTMRILLTGYADQDAITHSINEGEVFRYLTKPCPRASLTEAISLAVQAARESSPTAPTTKAPAQAGLPEPPAHRAARQPVAEEHQRPATVGARRLGQAATTTSDVRAHRAPDPATPAPMPAQAAAMVAPSEVEVLVLSSDGKLIASLAEALNQSRIIHAVESVTDAISVLDKHPIGVLVTDIAVNADEIQSLTSDLKQLLPELVTIVASDHSDAHRMIELINSGQVFRFLLKPIRAKQTSIWVESAVVKHIQLVRNPDLLARHVVDKQADTTLRRLGDQLLGVANRIIRFRERLMQTSEVQRECP